MAPTFVLVAGFWHTAAHLVPLVKSLARRQYSAKPVQMYSVGHKTTRPTFEDDVNTISSSVSQELQAGRDVCLMLHSFAGVAGAEAVNRVLAEQRSPGDGKLLRVIFLAAFNFPAGVVIDQKQFVGEQNPGFSIHDDGTAHKENPHWTFFNDLSLEEAQPWIDALDVAWYLGPSICIASEEWRKVPSRAILCMQDNAMPLELQKQMWQGVQSEQIDTAHTPYVSQPEKIADLLVRMAVD